MQTIVLWGTLLATGLVAASLWAQDSKTAVDDSQKNALELAQQGQALVRVGEPKKAIELLTPTAWTPGTRRVGERAGEIVSR